MIQGKKIIFTSAFILACGVSFAQMDSIPKKYKMHRTDTIDPQHKKDSMNVDTQLPPIKTQSDCAYKMENGKMMKAVDEKMQVMTKSEVLSNGDILMEDGTLKTKNGKTIILKEGDCIDRSGNLLTIEHDPKKDK